MKLQLIAAGCHIVHLRPIAPEQAWRFDPRRFVDIHNAVNRGGLSVLDQVAERMR